MFHLCRRSQQVGIWQGGTHNPDGSVCCSKDASQCKVQLIGMSGTMYADGDMNRTRFDSQSQGLIVNWYHPVNKQMAVEMGADAQHWHCTAYCPIEDGPYPDPLAFGAKAKDLGPATTPANTEHWQWKDTIFGIVPMDTQDWWITKDSPPAPVLNKETLTPFGTAPIGGMNSAFTNFVGGKVDKTKFNIDNVKTCPINPQGCGDDSSSVRAVGMDVRRTRFPLPSLAKLAELSGGKAGAGAATKGPVPASVAGAKPWPKDWSALESAIMVINQGGVQQGDEFCCESGLEGQCQVQLQSAGGQRYMDYTNQRTRIEDPVNGIEVDDYKAHKAMMVVHNGTHDVCQNYCPIDPDDTLDGGSAYFLDPNATDLGAATFMGEACEEWQWKDTIFGVVTMQINNFYADKTIDPKFVRPLAQVSLLTPFGGAPIGSSNMTWTGFKQGPQPASKFDIAGVDTCPEAQGCNAPPQLLRRLAAKQYHTFARNLKMLNAQTK